MSASNGNDENLIKEKMIVAVDVRESCDGASDALHRFSCDILPAASAMRFSSSMQMKEKITFPI